MSTTLFECIVRRRFSGELLSCFAGKGYATVASGTMINYKTGLKYWHTLDDAELGKIGVPWPVLADEKFKELMKIYKNDIGTKKRDGIMRKNEGRDYLTFAGYIQIMRHFLAMVPKDNEKRWTSGIFGALFTCLEWNTVGKL
jgi:hypothetical protein